MRLSPGAHFAQKWSIDEVAIGFRVDEVFSVDTPGSASDFPRFVVYPAWIRRIERAWAR